MRDLRSEVTGNLLAKDGRVFRAVTDSYPQSAIIIFEVIHTPSAKDQYDFLYVYANGQALSWAGYDGTHMEGRRLADVIPPSRLEEVKSFYLAAARGRSKEDVMTASNGRKYLIKAVPVKNLDSADLGILIILDLDGIMEHASMFMKTPSALSGS